VPELPFRVLEARPGSDCIMARTKFVTPEALIVISTDGYFDVFPLGARVPNARPAYRGTVDLLDREVRAGDRLTVRPDSIALRVAVASWSSEHGAAALRGEMGAGRNGKQVTPA
jgi:hypothetical protein